MQRSLCNMLHGPAGAIMGQTRFSVGTVTPSAATEGFDLVGSDLFPSSSSPVLGNQKIEIGRGKKITSDKIETFGRCARGDCAYRKPRLAHYGSRRAM